MVDPHWVALFKSKIGQREIKGPKHNPWIISMLVSLGAWWRDDEQPWCGTTMAWVMKQCGITPPKAWYRALSWATWGVPCPAQYGAVGVKSRKGGGHVFLIVGESKDKRHYLALSANQGDAVSIAPILKAEVIAIRWPPSQPQPCIPLPVMSAGSTVSEA